MKPTIIHALADRANERIHEQCTDAIASLSREVAELTSRLEDSERQKLQFFEKLKAAVADREKLRANADGLQRALWCMRKSLRIAEDANNKLHAERDTTADDLRELRAFRDRVRELVSESEETTR